MNATTRDHAEAIAIGVLQALAADPEWFDRFLTASGLDAANLRTAVAEAGFSIGVLDYVLSNADLLVACAAAIGEPPEAISQARLRLSPNHAAQ